MDTSEMIFVFGSNTAGIHGAGAARYAMDRRGAKFGVGYGRTGETYAIPSKGHRNVKNRSGRTTQIGDTLSLDVIRRYVEDFLKYAREHPELQFQVTCIGCGLAGLKHEDVAPMFALAPDNCWFDSEWQQIFDEQFFGKIFRYWGTF